MTRNLNAIVDLAKVMWRHVAAFVALALIILALLVGYAIGRPSHEPASSATPAADATGAPRMYTCSMHPSVRLPNPDDKCPICFMDLIPVTETGGGTETQLVLSEAAARMSGVETARVARFFPEARVRLFGKLTYAETKVARITAYFPGRLDRLFVNYVGVPVASGDHLAEIYSPQLLAAFEEIRQARLAVDNASSSQIVRTSTQRTLEAAREKLRLLGLTGEQVADAEAGTVQGDRLTIYTPIGGVVTHLAAREGDYVDTGSPIATVADLSYLWLDLEAYESQLPMLRWGQPVSFTVEAHPGEVFDGRISFIEPIVDDRTRTAAVRVTVANDGQTLKPGMFATATVRPRVASGGAVLSDELAGRWVSPMHPTVVKDGPGQCDICGMDLVPAEQLGVVGDPALLAEPLVIPKTAAMLTGTRAIVYVKVPGTESPTYEAREVRLGPVAGDFYVVESGLAEGEDVVVAGAFRIDSAMQILAKPSMMAPRDDEGAAPGSEPVPERFVASLTPIYAAYLRGQEALAADDLGAFQLAAADLGDAVDLVDAAGLVGEQLGAWRRAAARMKGEEATTMAAARVGFEQLSKAVLGLDERFGHGGAETWHVAYCPMAFDFKGASWLQRGTTINNPYFGAAMLRCGEIRGDRPARGAAAPAASATQPVESASQPAVEPETRDDATETPVAQTPSNAAPEVFVISLTPVYAAYLIAQESLAADDLETFHQAAGDLASALEFVDASALAGDDLDAWRSTESDLATPVGTTVDEARAAFETLSMAVLGLDDRFGHGGPETWHVAYCPMAFDFKGASWLQRGTTINNPYFGAAMLRCGSIKGDRPPLGERGNGHEGHDHE